MGNWSRYCLRNRRRHYLWHYLWYSRLGDRSRYRFRYWTGNRLGNWTRNRFRYGCWFWLGLRIG